MPPARNAICDPGPGSDDDVIWVAAFGVESPRGGPFVRPLRGVGEGRHDRSLLEPEQCRSSRHYPWFRAGADDVHIRPIRCLSPVVLEGPYPGIFSSWHAVRQYFIGQMVSALADCPACKIRLPAASLILWGVEPTPYTIKLTFSINLPI